jgi:Arc/MetJ family transcription regulator
MADVTVHIDDELYSKASRLAGLDKISVEDVVENALRRHLDYVDLVEEFPHMTSFSLENYELQRDSDESDEDFALRRSLFQ